jgi:hypothetical protein
MSKQSEENTDFQHTEDVSDDEDFGIFIGEYSTKFEEIKNPEFVNVINYLSEKYLGKSKTPKIEIKETDFRSLTKGNNSNDIFDDYQIIEKNQESPGIVSTIVNLSRSFVSSIFNSVFPTSNDEKMKKKLENIGRNPKDSLKFIDPNMIMNIFKSAMKKEKLENPAFELKIKLIFTELESKKGSMILLEGFTPEFMIPFGHIHSAISVGPIVRNFIFKI